MANIQPRRNKDGQIISYSIRVYRGKDLAPFTSTFKVSPTWTEAAAYKKAIAAAAKFEKECHDGQVAADVKTTFGEYADHVIEVLRTKGNKESTLADYEFMMKRIRPLIGTVKLCDLKAPHLDKLYAELGKEGGNKRTGGKLSPTTINRYHRFISIVLAKAVKDDLIPVNVADKADPPKNEHKKGNCVTDADIPPLLALLDTKPSKWRCLITVLASTGLRRGEVLGLRWKDITELDSGNSSGQKVLHVEQTVMYTPKKGVYIDTPKTVQGLRDVPLSADAERELMSYKAEQAAKHLRLTNPNAFIFTQDNGAPMHPDSVTTYIDRLCKANGLRHINPHAFRHYAATRLIENGMDIATVSRIVGHSRPSTTTDLYVHPTTARYNEAANIMNNIFALPKAENA